MKTETVFNAVRSAQQLAGKKLLLLSLHGSRAYDTATEESDYEVKGIYLADTNEFLGVFPRNAESPSINGRTKAGKYDVDFEVHEIGKFFKLLIKSNPNMLEYVFAEEYMAWLSSENHQRLKCLSSACISRLVFDGYYGMYKKNMPKYYIDRMNGKSISYFDWNKMTPKERKIDAKLLLVMLRSLLSAYYILSNGEVELHMTRTSEFAGKQAIFSHLVAAKQGISSLDLDFVIKEIEETREMAQAASESSRIPPNVHENVVKKIDEFIKGLRTRYLCLDQSP